MCYGKRILEYSSGMYFPKYTYEFLNSFTDLTFRNAFFHPLIQLTNYLFRKIFEMQFP